MQEEAAETLLAIEREYVAEYTLTAEDKAALARSAEDVRRGRFATSKQVRELFERYGA